MLSTSPSPSAGRIDTRAGRIGTAEVRLALRCWAGALGLRPLLWSLPVVVLGCVLGRAWAQALRAASPGDALLLAPALLGPALLALKYLLAPARRDAAPHHLSRARGAGWSAMGLAGAALLGLVSAHAARRWTPASDDISRLMQARQSRMQPLQPWSGRVAARVIEVKRGEESDFAVLDLSPSAGTSASLRMARGRVWAELKHLPQVLGAEEPRAASRMRAGDWMWARIELREPRAPSSAAERDERLFALVRGCWCEGKLKGIEAASPARAGWGAGELNAMLDAARERIAERFSSGFRGLGVPYAAQSARLATAMAFGEGGLREPLPREMRLAFKRAGVSHVLVASGAQVAMVCALLWGLARLLCAPIRHAAWRGWVAALLIVPALVFYALLVGGAASIWRAALIGLGALWIQSRGRRLDAMSLWCGALSLLLLCDPASLYDLSLQLSFGAAWGLIAFSRALQNAMLAPLRALQPDREPEIAEEPAPDKPQAPGPQAAAPSRLLKYLSRQQQGANWKPAAKIAAKLAVRRVCWAGARGLSGVAGVSLAAHAGTLPVLLYAFGTLSLGSLCANLPIVPLSALLVASGLGSLLLPLRPFHLFNYHLADGTARVVGIVAGWKSSWLEAPALSMAWTLALCAVGLCAAAAAAWPTLLLGQSAPGHEDEDRSEHEEPLAPTASERALLWRASARAAAEALRDAGAPAANWLGLSGAQRLAAPQSQASRPRARPQGAELE